MNKDHAIVIFDGTCNLCSSSVQFIIRRDKAKYFKFISLQSPKAQELLEGKFTGNLPDSLVLVENEKVYFRSRAALKISAKLTWPWKVVSTLRILPSFLIDPIYNLIAKNRYKIWGKKEECMIPTADTKSRFLD